MIIKLIPEDGDTFDAVEHYGVKEFFICGVKDNEDGREDFNDWKGGYKFLIGNLFYFLNQIQSEQESKNTRKNINASAKMPNAKANLKLVDPNIETEITDNTRAIDINAEIKDAVKETEKLVNLDKTPFIKKLSVDQPDLTLIDTDNIEEKR